MRRCNHWKECPIACGHKSLHEKRDDCPAICDEFKDQKCEVVRDEESSKKH